MKLQPFDILLHLVALGKQLSQVSKQYCIVLCTLAKQPLKSP